MGMSSSIQAFIPDTDATYQKHRKVLLVCLGAKVSLPKETAEYFGSEEPYEDLLDEKLEIKLIRNKHYKDYSADMTDGFEVDLTKLPEGVTTLRFTNSY